MSEEEEYRHVCEFIANHSYPTGFSKNQESFEEKVSRVFLYQEWASLLCVRGSEVETSCQIC